MGGESKMQSGNKHASYPSTTGNKSQLKQSPSRELSGTKNANVKKTAVPHTAVRTKKHGSPKSPAQPAKPSKVSTTATVNKPKDNKTAPNTSEQLGAKKRNQQNQSRTKLGPPRTVMKKKVASYSPPQKPLQKVTPPNMKTGSVYNLPPIMPLSQKPNPGNNTTSTSKEPREKIYPFAQNEVKKKKAAAIISKPPVSSLERRQNQYKQQSVSKLSSSAHNLSVVKATNRTVEFRPDSHKGKTVATKTGKSKPPTPTIKPKPIQPTRKTKPGKTTQLKPSIPTVPHTKERMQSQTAAKPLVSSTAARVQSRPEPSLKRSRQEPQKSSSMASVKTISDGNDGKRHSSTGISSSGAAKSPALREKSRRSQEKVKSALDKYRPTRDVGPVPVKKVSGKPQLSSEVNTKTKRLDRGYSTTKPASSTRTPSRVSKKNDLKKSNTEPRLPPVKPGSSMRSPEDEDRLSEQVRLRSMNEKEEEAFQKFKKQKIRVAWQTFQQDQAQIRLLETKNDELEEDIKQMEGKCRY